MHAWLIHAPRLPRAAASEAARFRGLLLVCCGTARLAPLLSRLDPHMTEQPAPLYAMEHAEGVPRLGIAVLLTGRAARAGAGEAVRFRSLFAGLRRLELRCSDDLRVHAELLADVTAAQARGGVAPSAPRLVGPPL